MPRSQCNPHWIAVLITIWFCNMAHAVPPVAVPFAEPALVGQGRLSVFVWDVYDAALYAPGGRYERDRPFSLSMTYLRSVEGSVITESSIDAIRDQESLPERLEPIWRRLLAGIFPDVTKGDILTGVYRADGTAVFYLNTKPLGVIEEPRLSRAFFDIWLSEKTSEPRLRKKLLGE